jgi:long-chain acyl-CoA synthetase
VEELIKHSAPVEAANVGNEDTYGIFYTGGTTGQSKGVMLTHTNVMVNALAEVGKLSYNANTRYLHCAPMFHLADGGNTFAVTMATGCHYFLMFNPPGVLAEINRVNMTHVVLVPTMLQMILALPNITDFKLDAVEYIIYGGSPMPEALLTTAVKVFKNAKFIQGYGMTECAPGVSNLFPEHHTPGNPKLTSCGIPVSYAEVKIVDHDGKELPPNSVGELIVRGPQVMKGYWNMPEKTAETLRGGWMHTGDGAMIDEDGFIFIKDRIKDMIITGGENVYSSEVENAVAKHPAVAQVAVIGTPDPKFVESVTAVVVLKPNTPATEADIIAHCKNLIAGYKCPRKVVFMEALPMSGAGKILKTELRKPFWAGKTNIYTKDDSSKSSYS